jgi:hypothetical protein
MAPTTPEPDASLESPWPPLESPLSPPGTKGKTPSQLQPPPHRKRLALAEEGSSADPKTPLDLDLGLAGSAPSSIVAAPSLDQQGDRLQICASHGAPGLLASTQESRAHGRPARTPSRSRWGWGDRPPRRARRRWTPSRSKTAQKIGTPSAAAARPERKDGAPPPALVPRASPVASAIVLADGLDKEPHTSRDACGRPPDIQNLSAKKLTY